MRRMVPMGRGHDPAVRAYANDAPTRVGMKAWTMIPGAASVGLTAGSSYAVKLWLPDPIASWSQFDIGVMVAAVTPTGVHAIGLYDASGTKLTDTADLAAVWNSTGPKTISWQTPQLNIGGPGVYVYVVFLASAAGTVPSLLGGTTLGGIVNGALTSGYVVARDSSVATALPASLTPNSWNATQLTNGKLLYLAAR